jgi:hypothetical protein
MKAKQPIPTEHEEQVHVISWCRGRAAITGDRRLELVHGDSSGVRVPIGCAVKMKRAGAVKGWPDIFVAVPCIDWTGVEQVEYHGLFIELKRQRGGVVSQEQKAIHELLRDQGYRVEVCSGAEEAIRVISDYLGLEV